MIFGLNKKLKNSNKLYEKAKKYIVPNIYPIEIITNAKNYLRNCPLNAVLFAYKFVGTLFDGTRVVESGNVTLVR